MIEKLKVAPSPINMDYAFEIQFLKMKLNEVIEELNKRERPVDCISPAEHHLHEGIPCRFNKDTFKLEF